MNIFKSIFIVLLFATCFDFDLTKIFAQETDKNEQEVAQENKAVITENSTEKTASDFKISELNENEKIPYETIKKYAQCCIDNAPEKNEVLKKLGIDVNDFDKNLNEYFKEQKLYYGNFFLSEPSKKNILEKLRIDINDFDKNLDEYFKKQNILDLSNSGLGEPPARNKFLFYIALADILQIKNLILRDNNLTTLPEEFFNLKNLEQLCLSDNQLKKISPQIGKLTNLQILSLSDNNLTKLPKQFSNLKELLILDLNHNQILEIPAWIGDLSNLVYLDLAFNNIKDIPVEIRKLQYLEGLNFKPIEKELPNEELQKEIQNIEILQAKEPSLNNKKIENAENILKLVDTDNLDELQKLSVEQLHVYDPNTGDTPLRLAWRKNNIRIQNYLIENGALKFAIKDIRELTDIISNLIFLVTSSWDILRTKCFYSNAKFGGLEMFSYTLFCFWERDIHCTIDAYKEACVLLHIPIKILLDGVAKCPEGIKFEKIPSSTILSILNESFWVDILEPKFTINLKNQDQISLKEILDLLEKIDKYAMNDCWLPPYLA